MTASDYCRIYEPIFVVRPLPENPDAYDPHNVLDTDETAAQVDRENGKFECVCNHDCPEEK